MPSAETILVVGAGIAGLAAARALRTSPAPYAVTVLEARDRIGGRIWTVRDSAGVAFDLGAQWIVGTEGNPIVDLARRLNLATFQTDWYSLALYTSSGARIRHTSQQTLEAQLHAVLSAVRTQRSHERATGKPDYPLRAAVNDVLSTQHMSARQRAELDFVICTDIEHELAADLSDLSTYHWDDEGRLEGGELLLPGGYNQVISHLALGTDIRTRHVVERIVAGKQGVTVATNRGVFSADRCLVTVPLGVLQAGGITFEPELSVIKRSALRNLRMGVLNKIFLRFPHVFWPEEHVIGHLAQQLEEWPWFVNLYPSTHKPVLLGLHAGSYGLRLEAMSDEELIAAAMNVLRRLFGQRIPQPIECHITRWGADPFTHGSYSHIPPGASADDYEVLAHPVDNRVFFAGEATAREYAGTVHGAYLSGLREAARIAAG